MSEMLPGELFRALYGNSYHVKASYSHVVDIGPSLQDSLAQRFGDGVKLEGFTLTLGNRESQMTFQLVARSAELAREARAWLDEIAERSKVTIVDGTQIDGGL